MSTRSERRPGRHSTRGQSIVEFALVAPVLLLILVAIADFGRLYATMVAVEAATREAADYGAFDANHWNGAPNVATTVAEIKRRACTAASGSHLQDYAEPSGTLGHADCSNPILTCELELPDGTVSDCSSYSGTGVCGDPNAEPPCIVHVRLDYTFHTILGLPPLPATISFSRDSRFLITSLTPP
jgi:TadE-like protein